jgi:hypothetical protein
MKKHTIVGISGKQGSGKTTLAKSLISKYSGIHLKFADPLYKMHEAIRGVLKEFDYEMKPKDGKLLQLLGTEWGRNTLGQSIWCSLTANKIVNTVLEIDKWDKAFIVVDDARFENELDLFKALKEIHPDWNVLTIRLECPETQREGRADDWRPATDHPSEVGLDGRLKDFDLVINTGMDSAEITHLRALNLIEAE